MIRREHPALTCTSPSPAPPAPETPAQLWHWEGCASLSHTGSYQLHSIFLKIKAISFPTCSSSSKQGQPAGSTISQLVYTHSSPPASSYRVLRSAPGLFNCKSSMK